MVLPTWTKDGTVLAKVAIGTGALGLLRYLYRALRCRTSAGKHVTNIKGWWPIVGHLPVLTKYMKDHFNLALGRLSLVVKEEEGRDIFRMCAFGASMVIVTDVEAIEEIVTNDPAKYTKNFDTLPGLKLLKEFFGNGLFFASTDQEAWAIPHHILKSPFSVRGVRALMPLMSEQADLLMACLKREVGYGGVCHIDHWVTKMAFETIAVCATGTSFGSFDDDQDSSFVKALNGCLAGFATLQTCPPQLWSLLSRDALTKTRVNGKEMRDICVDVIRKRRQRETQSSSTKKDVLDMMLEDTDPKTGKRMTEEMIVDNVLTFLFAGQDSTAASMATLMCYLNAYPHCKEKLVKEIDDVVGDGELEWDHLSKLQYLDWCMKEALRLVPPAPAFLRTSNGDQLLQNQWRLPAGTPVLVSVMAVHYDKKLWGDDACEFRPERWENGPPHKYAFIPFASGPRACTGREFTVIEQKITFVKLFQQFDFRRPASVVAEEGYTTLKKENQTMVPFINMDVEYKTMSGFIGLYSAFELLQRKM